MNYARLYYKIIENRLTNPINTYTEKHHIVPICLGGSNSKENLVSLTAREHFICHWLLVKMYKNNKISYHKLLKAFTMMLHTSNQAQERYHSRITSRIFDFYRNDFSKGMKLLQQGKNNSQFGTKWICNILEQKNKKISADAIIPLGWVLGRNKWVIATKIKKEKPIPKRKYNNGYKVMVNNKIFNTISQAADFLGIGHETARMRFKSKSFPNYVIIND